MQLRPIGLFLNVKADHMGREIDAKLFKLCTNRTGIQIAGFFAI
ncbi:hypothetical protein R1T40_22065 (plasmid) [Tritonibacter scottomollicae]|uniref:Uncharacterized protein n=1 Tax=Tritonibacter scottomollicae TaxID=483013 RepID=A0ABZ0HKT3_TRISK|nr:hypothetical protein R1T40_22065 [Tritonibacter scottomollicae]